jgi:chromosome segregation ATPase
LESAASDVERLTGTIRSIAREVQDLEAAAATAQGAQAQVQQLKQSVEELTRRLDAVASPSLLEELAERTQQFEAARARVARLETKLADWDALEQRVDQALRLATERRAVVDAIRSDLQRLFEVADGTVARVRELAGLQEQVGERRQALDPVIAKLQNLDRQAEALEERNQQFQEAEERLSRLDALLIDLQTTLKTVLDQKEFLERVVETTGTLALQTMQAEAAIRTLREGVGPAKRQPPS